jgi:hypothetical protein
MGRRIGSSVDLCNRLVGMSIDDGKENLRTDERSLRVERHVAVNEHCG